MIGVFDSGIGGLTVLASLRRDLPGRDLLYLGDTARVPYGTRSGKTVVRYSLRVASELVDRGIEALVIACNTATTHALPALSAAGAEIGLPVFGVVQPGARAAIRAHQQGAIGILGTEGTIRGGAYQAALSRLAPEVPLHAVACPMFVPLVEEGWVRGPVPEQIAEHYLGHLRGKIDTAILGCTHYPLLHDVLAKVLPGVTLVDSSSTTSAEVAAVLGPGHASGQTRFLVTDNIERFQHSGRLLFGQRPEPVTWVDLGPATGAFVHQPLD